MSQLIKELISERNKAWDAAKTANDVPDAERTADHDTTFAAALTAIDDLDARIKQHTDVEERAKNLDTLAEKYGDNAGAKPEAPSARAKEAAALRKFLKGESRSFEAMPPAIDYDTESRVLSKLTGGAGGNTVPTSFYEQLTAHLIEVSGVMMAGPTVFNTQSGEIIEVPITTSHSVGALVAEGAVIPTSEPAFGKRTLSAYKYGALIQVSTELVNDTGVDLLGYLAMQAGRACGNALGQHLVVGTGVSQPAGLALSASTGVTGGAGVGGLFTADNLIDLQFSVIAPYRSSPSCAWLMRDATLATVRKLKDTTNQYLWQPALVIGAPDQLLGKPVYTDPFVAAPAVTAKSVLFGDISQYFVRLAGGIRFERSDEFAFNADLVTFRCLVRGDGLLADQTGAVKAFVGNAT